MAGNESSPPTAGPALQTVLTLTAGNSDEQKRVFRWGNQIGPVTVGVKGAWYVHAPGVLDVHLYIHFDGRMVQVASASQSAAVTVAGGVIDQTWHPVPVRTEVRFGQAAIAVTCEEVPGEASAQRGSSPPAARTSSLPQPKTSAPPAARTSSPAPPAAKAPAPTPPVPRSSAPPAANPPPAASPPPAAEPLGPRTLIVTTPEDIHATPMEPALPRTGTLLLMERAWAPPLPGEIPQRPSATPLGQAVGRNTPHVPLMAPPGIETATAPPPRGAPPIVPLVPRALPHAPAVITQPPTASPLAPGAITQPPGAFAGQAPIAPLRKVITAPSGAADARGQALPPRDAHPAEQITQPPTVVGRTQSAPPPPIAPVAHVTPPTTPMPEPIPTAAPQSEAIPTMADGGALREHAKRLESLPRDATDPATLEYFSAVRAYSGKQPSDPPPPNAARTFASNEVSTPQQADNRGPDKSPKGFENPPRQPPLQPQSPPEPQPPVFRTAEMAPPVVETPTPAQKPKGALRQAWQETSRVKKAIVFLMPLAAVVTIYQFEPQAEPESPPAPAVNDEKVGAATASVTKEVSPPPSAGALGSAQATEEASAAASAAAAGLKTAVEAPSSSATAGSVNSIQVQPVASGAKPAPVGIASATASATNAAATSSAPPPQPPGSAVPTGVASGAVATAAPGSTEMVQPEAALMAHDALTAAFDGNLARSASLYQQLSSAHPTSQLYSLAARFTKEGAVRTP